MMMKPPTGMVSKARKMMGSAKSEAEGMKDADKHPKAIAPKSVRAKRARRSKDG